MWPSVAWLACKTNKYRTLLSISIQTSLCRTCSIELLIFGIKLLRIAWPDFSISFPISLLASLTNWGRSNNNYRKSGKKWLKNIVLVNAVITRVKEQAKARNKFREVSRTVSQRDEVTTIMTEIEVGAGLLEAHTLLWEIVSSGQILVIEQEAELKASASIEKRL